MTALSGWQNFYVIAGSSAGALIGLQFVVMSLISGTVLRTDAQTGSAFGTPTVVHFGAVLALSAVLPKELFVGIHNVWDAVTYHLFVKSKRQTP